MRRFLVAAAILALALGDLRAQSDSSSSGSLISKGNGLFKAKDFKGAFGLYQQAALEGNPTAMFNVGLCYDQGLGVDVSHFEAYQWYKKAADAGIVHAKYNLALFLKNGIVIGNQQEGGIALKSDPAKAAALFQETVAAGFVPAKRELGDLLITGTGVERDASRGRVFLNEAADAGDGKAMLLLAQCAGASARSDPAKRDEMIRWLEKAVDKDLPEAMGMLAYCCERGEGVDKDAVRALRLYAKAADLGLATAQCRMGDYYAEGGVVAQDFAAACAWYEKAARQEDPRALFLLGVHAIEGMGDKPDARKAAKLFMRAAHGGFAKAQHNLACLYLEGRGVDHDPKLACFWFRKAAELNDPASQRELGLRYLEGFGVDTDRNAALEWLGRAAQNGDRQAANLLRK